MKIKEVTIGEIRYDDNGNIIGYEGGSTENGVCFKDEEAFKSGKGVCYISEYGLDDLHEKLGDLTTRYGNGDVSDEEFRKLRDEVLNDKNIVYTRKEFIDLVDGEVFAPLAEQLFYECDWEYPETKLEEWSCCSGIIEFEEYGIPIEAAKKSETWCDFVED
jgi:hypothetical protein